MAFQILFEGSVAKHAESPEDNEDAYRMALEKGRVVLSDGASESFDARSWANLLVDQFLDTDPSDEAIGSCIQAYKRLHDPSKLSWSKAAAYERGSYATLVIAQDDPNNQAITIISVGDSLAVWSKDDLIETTPYSHSDQFIGKPTLIATRQELNASVRIEESGTWNRMVWTYGKEGGVLLCMTDALGAWLLQNHERGNSSAFERLSCIKDQQEFIDLVEGERASGVMRRDDTTLIIVAVGSSK